jgi:hypothetical protein
LPEYVLPEMSEVASTSEPATVFSPVVVLVEASPPDRIMDGRGRHVFISYSREDRRYVVSLADYLQRAGVNVWYDSEISAGDRVDTVLQQRIDTCAAVVVIWSPAASTSDWVADEIVYARWRQKPIVPLLLHESDLPMTLIRVQAEDVRGGLMPGDNFIDRLRSLGGDTTLDH